MHGNYKSWISIWDLGIITYSDPWIKRALIVLQGFIYAPLDRESGSGADGPGSMNIGKIAHWMKGVSFEESVEDDWKKSQALIVKRGPMI